MTTEQLQRLLNEACELLIIFEDGNVASDEDKVRIASIFNEIKYSDDVDAEMQYSADAEVQDWNTFGNKKI